MVYSERVTKILDSMSVLDAVRHYAFLTPELLLLAMCSDSEFSAAFFECGGDIKTLEADLEDYLKTYVPTRAVHEVPAASDGLTAALRSSQLAAMAAGKDAVELRHVVKGLYMLPESYAVYFMVKQDVDEASILSELSSPTTGSTPEEPDENVRTGFDMGDDGGLSPAALSGIAPCLNDTLVDVNPLIGREKELERTIQVLCRRDKNNPLHIGEPGVGKTAITYGLVQRIVDGDVPDALKGSRVFALDLGGLLAGTQYRGNFEKRVRQVMDRISKEDKPIVFIDEIHTLLGAGATGEGAMDAANLLKPYLSQGHVRFIGATTYDEYKKHFEKSKSLVRRFQNIEICEPSVEESVEILKGLRKKYEDYHGVVYGKGVLEHAVDMSAKYINERYLPDKAIDLMDEAGAYRKIHPLPGKKKQVVDCSLIDEILTNICNIPKQTVESDESEALATLEKRMLSKIFGQDRAVSQVVNAVKFSRAGLKGEDKPLASLLFVGPTGVGKTEIARTLASELGVKMVRFDMSEYGEKHSVAKLIGSPAGYVGYEEGGLLTEEIRKNPTCVLLLDEIEKAHPSIFNTLLQIMDYATLTDNQGRKADFRHVILIMTSNIGASRLGKMGVGFRSVDTTSDTLLEEVKNAFQPEFRNRLTATVIFNNLDDDMAERIAVKKLGEMEELLSQKSIRLSHTPEAVALLKEKGTSKEYGARELDRVIGNDIKPLLVDEILFGSLKNGGDCLLTAEDGSFRVIFGRAEDGTDNV